MYQQNAMLIAHLGFEIECCNWHSRSTTTNIIYSNELHFILLTTKDFRW